MTDEADGFLWYCERCDARLYGEYLHVTNIETDLPPVFDRFWSNPEHTRCRTLRRSHAQVNAALEFMRRGPPLERAT